MKIRESRFLRGPNVWAACPVIELTLVTDDLEPAKAFVAVLLRLQEIAGTPVRFSVLVKTAAGVLAAVEFAEEAVVRGALEIAVGPGEPRDDEIMGLKKLLVQARFQSVVTTTYVGAKKLGIPVCLLSAEYKSFLVLGQGSKQHRIKFAEPDVVSGVGRLASIDKYLTNQLLRSIGIPVARGKLLAAGDDPWAAASEVGLPVAIKPYDCDVQIGVSLDLRTKDRIEAAFRVALENSEWALVEHFAPGMEHRVIVVGDRVVAVTRIDPPHVIGDGASTVAELVARTNRDPRRSPKDGDGPCYKIYLDDVAEAVLASQGMTTASVPAAGQMVLVRRDPPYFKNGGNLTDLTDVIHPSTVAHCVAAACMMQVPVAGLDVVALDITRPLEEQEGIIVELNSNPGLWLHLAPWADSPRPVGEEIARWLFRGSDGRIPVVALAGDDRRLVGPRLTALLTSAGQRVGMARAGEMSANGRHWKADAQTPQERAYVLFRNPEIDVALFDTDAAELLQHGFASDRCDVALLLSPPGPDEREAEFVRALTHALAPGGTFVTTSAWSPEKLGVPAAKVILIAEPSEVEARNLHIAAGGRVVAVRGGQVVLGDRTGPDVVLGSIPADLPDGEVRSVLCALAILHAIPCVARSVTRE